MSSLARAPVLTDHSRVQNGAWNINMERIIHGQDHTRFVLMSLKYSLPFCFVNLEVQVSEGKYVVREAINLPGSPVRNGPRENNIGRTKL